jgi:hypothetical protein
MVHALHANRPAVSTAGCQKHEAIHKNSERAVNGLTTGFVALQQQKWPCALDIMRPARA